jgi:hypothetical protein
MQDGRDTRNRTPWLIPRLDSGNISSLEGYLENGFELPVGFMRKVRELLGKDTEDAHIEVDRYKREWLLWERKMGLTQFYTNILWKIDHPVINVYPRNWVSSNEFISQRGLLSAPRVSQSHSRVRTKKIRKCNQREPRRITFKGQRRY